MAITLSMQYLPAFTSAVTNDPTVVWKKIRVNGKFITTLSYYDSVLRHN
jgi:hypothetical protein